MPDLRYTIVRAGLLLPRPKSGTCPAFVQGMRAGLKGESPGSGGQAYSCFVAWRGFASHSLCIIRRSAWNANAGLPGVISRQTLAEVVLAACEAPNALAGTTFTAVEIAAAPDSPPSAKVSGIFLLVCGQQSGWF